MATMVRHKQLDELFAMVGSGYSRQSQFKPDGTPGPEWKASITDFQIAICSSDGELHHVDAEDLEVVSIDGRPIAELFVQNTPYRG